MDRLQDYLTSASEPLRATRTLTRPRVIGAHLQAGLLVSLEQVGEQSRVHGVGLRRSARYARPDNGEVGLCRRSQEACGAHKDMFFRDGVFHVDGQVPLSRESVK